MCGLVLLLVRKREFTCVELLGQPPRQDWSRQRWAEGLLVGWKAPGLDSWLIPLAFVPSRSKQAYLLAQNTQKLFSIDLGMAALLSFNLR
jgi:hypothetical protein